MPYICSHTKLTFQLRYFIEIAYNGTNYHGWQLQPNAITVQELINKAIATIFRTDINVVGAGRTDTGVHSEQLFAHLDLEVEFNVNEFKYKVNSLLPNDIAVLDIRRVLDDAHARFNATSRSYEYRMFLGKNPFLIDTSLQLINKKLNIDKMNEAARILLTYTNFKCFSRSNSDVKTYNCDITIAEWKQTNQQLIFYITADRFLRNMVRAIVGTLMEVGTGKTTIEEFKKIIESEDRRNAGPSAPAHGLFLTQVSYPKKIFIDE
ncbi:tRNA pseudouridine(38-40) synthase TruA [Lutibacter flavus]|uniref:tRNA pseudouridine synthase A n=1 Tax=Lutibacter flavus TaxID=691689 RepID=A0A238Z0R2_9FLAO|nr:tRNA pseudouridine(38-40) synthase TruA [Lutibacter flavus]SNR76957.1 tRNA pseudouridine38-40 synthase [Lutibacter flavus]